MGRREYFTLWAMLCPKLYSISKRANRYRHSEKSRTKTSIKCSTPNMPPNPDLFQTSMVVYIKRTVVPLYYDMFGKPYLQGGRHGLVTEMTCHMCIAWNNNIVILWSVIVWRVDCTQKDQLANEDDCLLKHVNSTWYCSEYNNYIG